MRGFLRYMGCPADALDDLVQDVFLSVLSSRFEERNESATAAFLRRVARNLLLKSLRRQRTQPSATDVALAEEAWVEFEQEDGGKGYVDALRHCYAFLGERASSVLQLRYDEKLGGAAIAERLGMKEAGVKSILVRAKKKLRDCIQRRLAS